MSDPRDRVLVEISKGELRELVRMAHNSLADGYEELSAPPTRRQVALLRRSAGKCDYDDAGVYNFDQLEHIAKQAEE